MSDQPETIRSYQRIFRPERRIYSIEGRALPIPGGVPLRWLAYATGTLVCLIALSAGSQKVALLAAAAAGLAGLLAGRRAAAAAAALGAFGTITLCGWVVARLDWPLRLIVIPAALATLATQATPDGRRAERFARSWLWLRLQPRRRSLGRALPGPGRRQLRAAELWVSPDERSPELRRGRVRGPATASFAAPLAVSGGRVRRRRLIARPPGAARHRRGGDVLDSLELGDGEVVEVRP